MIFRALLAALVLFASSVTVQAVTVSSDLTPFATHSFGNGNPAVRFRSPNSGGEVYVGTKSTQPPRVESGLVYGPPSAFSIVYRKATGTISASYGASTPLAFTVTPGAVFNAMQIVFVGPGTAQNFFTLSGLIANGAALPQGLAGRTTGTRAFVPHYLWNFADASGDITLTGTLAYSGPFTNTSAEAARIDFTLGNVTPVPLPAAGWMLLASFCGLALLRRRTA